MKHLIIGILTFLFSAQLCAQSPADKIDIDSDDNGLIEIHNLEMLNAMRYQLDGSGYTASTSATKITTGCAIGGCRGYELMRDLSFMDDTSYTTASNRVLWTVADYEDNEDTGWEPIGTFAKPFNATFEGNGHTLSRLMINHPDNDVGLFGGMGRRAMLSNLALLDLHVRGNRDVGGLVGDNRGNISYSYATGTVEGSASVGNLVGVNDRGRIANSYARGTVIGSDSVGGLVGDNRGDITNSYAMGTAEGSEDVGGLVGWNFSGSITNSYAIGTVEGADNVGGLFGWNFSGNITNSYAISTVEGDFRIGGLAGWNNIGGTITNSYAMGAVTGTNNNVGGLVGDNRGSIVSSYATGTVLRKRNSNNVGGLIGQNFGNITKSYWDRQTSGISVSDGGARKTTLKLQSPTTATGIYRTWSTADWDFSSPSHYPLLKYAVADRNNPACGVSGQPACGTLLPYQLPSLLTELVVVNATMSPSFDPEIVNYDVTVAFDATYLELRTTATDASIRIRSDTSDSEVRSTNTASAVIRLSTQYDTVIRIEVVKDEHRPKVYQLTVPHLAKPSTPVIVFTHDAQPIAEGATIALRVPNNYQCDTDLSCKWDYRDAASQTIGSLATELSTDSLQLNITVPTDYVDAAQTTQQLIVLFTVSNRGGAASAQTPLIIMKQNNGPISATHIGPPTSDGISFSAPELDRTDLETDPDGAHANPTLHYQWQRTKSDAADLNLLSSWENIDGAISKTYPPEAPQATSHRVQIRYTDGQGYPHTIYSTPIEVHFEGPELKVWLKVFLEAFL